MKKVLILAGYFIPSVKAGGPIQSINNMIKAIEYNSDVYVLAYDRDLGDSAKFDHIETGVWLKNDSPNCKIMYLPNAKLFPNRFFKFNELNNFDIIYFNGFFSISEIFLPLLYLKIIKSKNKNILSPRGEFSPGALGLKKTKKIFYLSMFKFLKLSSLITWHTTSNSETEEVKNIMKSDIIFQISNIPSINNPVLEHKIRVDRVKKPNEAKFLFISRIHKKKNLHYFLKLLQNTKGDITFDIYGPIEDQTYWDECLRLIDTLPKNICVSYKGVIKQNEICNILYKYHFFVLLTLGENFGHAIVEALFSSMPVLISNNTPWNNLERYNAGWDIPLSDSKKIDNTINLCVRMNNDQYALFSHGAFNYIDKLIRLDDIVNKYKKLFE